MAKFFDDCMDDIGIDMLTISPGYAYERAPDQQHFLNREKTRNLFRDIFRRDKKRKWRFSQSSLFLDVLAGIIPTLHALVEPDPYLQWQQEHLLGGLRPGFKSCETTEWDSRLPADTRSAPTAWSHCGLGAPP
jgi:hypothetical protein